MNKVELAKAVAAKIDGCTNKHAKEMLDTIQEVVFATIPKEEVKVFDGVTLSAVKKDARVARNPRTGESVEVPSKVAPKCKFGKPIKEALNA